MTELSAQRPKMPWLYANSACMFETKPPWNDGTNGAVENNSSLVFVDAIRIHSTGSTQYRAPTIRMIVGIRLTRERCVRRWGVVAAAGPMADATAIIAHSFAKSYGVSRWRSP